MHKWLGFLISAGATWHVWKSMYVPGPKTMNSPEFYLGTAGWLLILFQIGVGLALEKAQAKARNRFRKVHFCTMFGILAFTSGHILTEHAVNIVS